MTGSIDPKTGIYFEIHGAGAPLFLAFPIFASYAQIFGNESPNVTRAFLERLTDRYRVLVVDYPSIGRSAAIPPDELTADRVSADFLAIATAANFERFAYWGYSWGAAAGLQLASRTNRLSALVLGGWPPLGARYEDMLAITRANAPDPPKSASVVLRNAEQYRQWATFYESVVHWPEEQALAKILCPRMLFYGSEGDAGSGEFSIPIASIIKTRRTELEAKGWHVVEIPGRGHDAGLDAATVAPIVRAFLDRIS